MSEKNKDLNELIREEKANLVKKSFNMGTFLKLMSCYINTPDFESHEVEVDGDKAKEIMTTPVKNFREVVMNILVDYGVDKDEAATMLTTYKFRSKDLWAIYQFITDFMYEYLKTGRPLKVFNKKDISASIYLKPQLATTKEHKTKIRDKESGKVIGEKTTIVETGEFYKLGQKSGASKWNKKKLDTDGNVISAMERIFK